MIAIPQILRRLTNSKLLVIAAVVHLILTTGVYAIGRLGIHPAINKNGGVTALSPDSGTYLLEANELAHILIQRGPVVWLVATGNFHVKLYSLSLVMLGPLLGANILSIEPINLLLYLSILWLTFKLGEELFDRNVSFLATAAVALWPSWLLHTTQLLKDQVFVVLLLILVLIMACWLTRSFSLMASLTTAIAGGAASYIISLTRSGLWGVLMIATVLMGTGLLLVRQIRERRILVGNIISAGLIVAATSAIFLQVPERLADSFVLDPARVSTPARQQTPSLVLRANQAAERLSLVRRGFLDLSMSSGSNIDANVEFASILDVARYLPRAVEIGFLAPFPNQWFQSGQAVGSAGRLLSGLEISAFYIIEFMALIGLWRSRSNLRVWLLVLVSSAGVVPLAFAVPNLGALYRFRYGFFILVIILGAHGLMTLLAQSQQPSTDVNEV